MNAHAHAHGHSGHETTDLDSPYAVWSIPFSLLVLLVFVLVIVLWVPAAVSREMKAKEVAGAEAGRQSLIEHRALQAGELEARGPDRMPVEQAMAAIVNNNARTVP